MNILVVMPANDTHREKLQKAAPSAAFTYASAKELSRDQVQNADIIIGNAPADRKSVGRERVC